MSIRSDIEKRIAKLQTEMNGLHGQAAELWGEIEQREFAVQELQAVLKGLPPDEGAEGPQPEPALRKNSDVGKARELLREVRTALHVDDILRRLNRPINKKSRASLSGQISIYVRKGQIFTKPEPNTFGLREWKPRPDGVEVVGTPLDEHYKITVPVPAGDEVKGLPLEEASN